MKQKLSITVEEESVKILESMLNDGLFRNRSHIVEVALNKLIKENQNE
jgi:Arc/MetJ-type ribon-helix-helix transcriptional regulator